MAKKTESTVLDNKPPKESTPSKKVKATSSTQKSKVQKVLEPSSPTVKPKQSSKERSSKESNKLIKVQQYGSPIRRDRRQALYLKSLGLGKMNSVRELQDNDIVRSLLAKLPHMVKVISE
jgi:large subunit ribosomal protein L30